MENCANIKQNWVERAKEATSQKDGSSKSGESTEKPAQMKTQTKSDHVPTPETAPSLSPRSSPKLPSTHNDDEETEDEAENDLKSPASKRKHEYTETESNKKLREQ